MTHPLLKYIIIDIKILFLTISVYDN